MKYMFDIQNTIKHLPPLMALRSQLLDPLKHIRRTFKHLIHQTEFRLKKKKKKKSYSVDLPGQSSHHDKILHQERNSLSWGSLDKIQLNKRIIKRVKNWLMGQARGLL